MVPGKITYNQSKIAYQLGGQGHHFLLCFHGYGENASSFGFLEKYLGDHFKILAIDLPFHGETDWMEADLDLSGWNQAVESVLNACGYQAGNNLSLMGYSLGGRVVLQYYQDHPNRINKILLLAPDGLKVNFWYWLSTQTILGNRLFKFTMRHPGIFLYFLRGLNRFKLINSSIYKFVHYYIGNPQVRIDLYRRWTTLRKIKPDLKRIAVQVKKESIPVILVYGRHDRIILPNRGYRFQEAVGPTCSLHIIESGHQVLHEKHISALLPLLLP